MSYRHTTRGVRRERGFANSIVLGALALALTLVGASVPSRAQAPVSGKTASHSSAVKFDPRSVPMSFVANAGQSPADVRFQVNSMGGVLSFIGGAVVLDLPLTSVDDLRNAEQSAASTDESSVAIQVRYVGARQNGRIVPAKKLPGVINYFIGDDQDKWLRDVPTYGGIVYEGLYPGIDLSYDGVEGRLKGTFHVAAGVDPSVIKWRYEGTGSPRLDEAGNLVLAVTAAGGLKTGKVSELAPVAWQTIDGVQHPVEVAFAIAEDGSLSFRLGAYDRAQSLVIDPILLYSTYLGGNGTDHVVGMKIDNMGCIYVTGRTHSNSANPGPGWPIVNPLHLYGGEIADAYVTKFDATGQSLMYSTYLGGGDPTNFFIIGGADWGLDIDIDALGQAHIVGLTESNNFPTTPNAASPFRVGGITDAFYTVLSPQGNALVYSTYLGGTGADYAWGVKLDAAGNALIGGYTASVDFPRTAGAYQITFGGLLDAFLMRIGTNGQVTYSTYFGFDGFELAYDVDVDAAGDAYLTGGITSTVDATLVNPLGVAPLQPLNGGLTDSFVVRFNLGGNGSADLRYFTYWGGVFEDYAYGMEVDANFFVYTTGITGSFNFPTRFTQLPFGGDADCFVAKHRTTGSGLNDLKYSITLGGLFFDQGFDIAVNSVGAAYVGGLFTSFLSTEAFWVKLEPNFGFVLDFDLFGTPFFDMVLGIDVNAFDIMTCGGYTSCINGATANLNCVSSFQLFNALQPQYGGGNGDGFVRTYFVP